MSKSSSYRKHIILKEHVLSFDIYPIIPCIVGKAGCPGGFQCEHPINDMILCMPLSWVCDGDPVCDDGSDEPSCCYHNMKPCDGGFECIPKDWKCDNSRYPPYGCPPSTHGNQTCRM